MFYFIRLRYENDREPIVNCTISFVDETMFIICSLNYMFVAALIEETIFLYCRQFVSLVQNTLR